MHLRKWQVDNEYARVYKWVLKLTDLPASFPLVLELTEELPRPTTTLSGRLLYIFAYDISTLQNVLDE